VFAHDSNPSINSGKTSNKETPMTPRNQRPHFFHIVARLSLFCAISLIAPLASSAAPITVPTDLNLGDKYRLAFVTSTVRDATSSDIADYNDFVTAVATGVSELAALGTTWTAIGSTGAIDARDNTGTNPTVSTGVPIYLLNDTRIADDNADLWDGAIPAVFTIFETGTWDGTIIRVWTGTQLTGIGEPSRTLGAAGVRSGSHDVVDSRWVFDVLSDPSSNNRMYGLSGELTVVPEPSTLLLAACGAIGLWIACLSSRRQRKVE
jgi:hypothetical protein